MQVVYADMCDERAMWAEQEEREKETIADLKRAAAALLNDPQDRPPADARAGAPNGSSEEEVATRPQDDPADLARRAELTARIMLAPIIDGAKLAEIVKDYDTRHPTTDYTLAKYRTQTN